MIDKVIDKLEGETMEFVNLDAIVTGVKIRPLHVFTYRNFWDHLCISQGAYPIDCKRILNKQYWYSMVELRLSTSVVFPHEWYDTVRFNPFRRIDVQLIYIDHIEVDGGYIIGVRIKKGAEEVAEHMNLRLQIKKEQDSQGDSGSEKEGPTL